MAHEGTWTYSAELYSEKNYNFTVNKENIWLFLAILLQHFSFSFIFLFHNNHNKIMMIIIL